MTSYSQRCGIWPAFPASDCRRNRFDRYFLSDRAGGAYWIADDARIVVEGMPDSQKARLTTWLIDQRLQGVAEPEVTKEVLTYIETVRPLSVQARAERLLRFVANQVTDVGTLTAVETHNGGSLAWSESIGGLEVRYFYNYLQDKGWISGQITGGGFSGFVTVDGYAHISESIAATASVQGFIAMWIHDSTDAVFRQGIEPAIQEAGYQPLRIDQKPDVVKIDDEIMAEIRRSRFLVADFTQHEREARGGVYYEAGFAEGLDIPVIYTCRRDCVETLHFDTRQYAHIVWETPEELRIGLTNRIRNRIGQGPTTS